MRAGTALLTLCAVGVAGPAQAQVEGRYTGRGEGNLSAVVSRGAGPERFKVVLKTRARNCNGEVSGAAVLANGTMTLNAKTDEPKGCTLVLRPAGGTLKVDEQQGCLFFHGVSCGFSGTLKRR